MNLLRLNYILSILLFSLQLSYGQQSNSRSAVANKYYGAIEVFLSKAFQDSIKLPDSLFVSIPEELDTNVISELKGNLIINKVPVKILNPLQAVKYSNSISHKKLFINLISWKEKECQEFIAVAFGKDMRHYFDCFFCLQSSNNKYLLSASGFKLEKYIYDSKGQLIKIDVYKNGKFFQNKPLPNRK